MGGTDSKSPKLNQLYSDFYGFHQIVHIGGQLFVKKLYSLSSSIQKQSFIALLEKYKQVNLDIPTVLQLKYYKAVQNGQQEEQWTYEVYYEYLPRLLSDDLQENMNNNLSLIVEGDIFEVIDCLSSALLAFQFVKFPCSAISTNKIGVKQIEQNHKKIYTIGLDLLLNQHKYMDMSIQDSDKVQVYKSPEELDHQNLQSLVQHRYENKIKSRIYSIGLIALEMAKGYLDRSKLEEEIFSCRKHYSYEFCTILSHLLEESYEKRSNLETVYEMIKPCLNKNQKLIKDSQKERSFHLSNATEKDLVESIYQKIESPLRQNKSQYRHSPNLLKSQSFQFIRGFNCPESDYLLQEIFIDRNANQLWHQLISGTDPAKNI